MFDIGRNIPMLISLVFIVGGLATLAWSADRFVGAAGSLARALGVSPLVVGMVVIGFGTSAPELAVSVLSGLSGHSNLSLGNAYGSCIFNIGAILGLTAVIRPVVVSKSVVKVAVPLLVGTSVLSYLMVRDMAFSRANGMVLFGVFAVLLPFYCWYDQGRNGSVVGAEQPEAHGGGLRKEWLWLVVGLVLLVVSSHLLVWGCVDFARDVLHVSELMIGLTVVAVGTSLPELASAIASARKGENDFVIGNIVGSNFFNTLAVVGLAGSISPFRDFSRYVVSRDLPVMAALSISIAVFGMDWHRRGSQGTAGRFAGCVWLLSFAVYLFFMVKQEVFK